jgi:hypothetical protein
MWFLSSVLFWCAAFPTEASFVSAGRSWALRHSFGRQQGGLVDLKDVEDDDDYDHDKGAQNSKGAGKGNARPSMGCIDTGGHPVCKEGTFCHGLPRDECMPCPCWKAADAFDRVCPVGCGSDKPSPGEQMRHGPRRAGRQGKEEPRPDSRVYDPHASSGTSQPLDNLDFCAGRRNGFTCQPHDFDYAPVWFRGDSHSRCGCVETPGHYTPPSVSRLIAWGPKSGTFLFRAFRLVLCKLLPRECVWFR